MNPHRNHNSPAVQNGLWLTPLLVAGLACPALAADAFRDRVLPFVRAYCADCHNPKTHEAELNLARYDSAASAADDFRQWEHVLTFVERGEMPPAAAVRQPSADERREFLATVRAVLAAEARNLRGDPGVVLPRRLSHAEYDHSIRDLTGVDIRPTRSFPVDPAAGEGFDNTGEALAMSPPLVAKLYAAAQHVADHALLTTTGLRFAPYPVTTFADRTKFYEQAILQFYEQHRVDYESYLGSCWEYQHRASDLREQSLADWARARRHSATYLSALYELLAGDPQADAFYVGWLRRRWRALSPADVGTAPMTPEVSAAIRGLARDISTLSRQLTPRETEAIVSNAGNGPVQHLQRRRQTAAERDTLDARVLQPERRLRREVKQLDRARTVRITLAAQHLPSQRDDDTAFVVLRALNFSRVRPEEYKPTDAAKNDALRQLISDFAPEQLDRARFGTHPGGHAVEPDDCVLAAPGSIVFELPARAFGDLRETNLYLDAQLDRPHSTAGGVNLMVRVEILGPDGRIGEAGDSDAPAPLVDPDHVVARAVAESGSAFCRVFPNRFFYVDDTRGLSAGFHLIEGFFRDDQPLVKLVLAEAERKQLDELWTELEFSTAIAEKMLRGFVFFERSERNFLKHADFDPFKEEDPKLVEPETLARFERVYLDRSNVSAPVDQLATHPIHIFFEQIRQGLQQHRDQLRTAEPIYLTNLLAFARSAYRRPLTRREQDDLQSFFRAVAGTDELGLEQAVRSSLVRILMSPYFHAHVHPAPPGDTVGPLADLALASRLSYFLWSSMPDAELLEIAESGKLHDDTVLVAQTRRMLADPRVADFAREFFGQWLGYRDFPREESVDRSLFRDFDEALKESLYQEPTRLAAHLIRTNDSIMKLLDSDFTFVDQRLASHYGLPFSGQTPDEWVLVKGLAAQGRGGILGMGVFLTKLSQPQRTSPVKRGFWVVHQVLGEHIPAPPADVVALPAKETDTNGLTIRQLLARHVADAKCSRCHQRFDAIGLAMEGFDPIGRRRTKDLAGRPIDDVVALPDGTESRGIPAFARYLAGQRRNEFLNTFDRKLLGYALGRSLQLSDEVLLDELRITLDKQGDRIVPLVEMIVRSPQFRNQRCRDFSPASFRQQNQGDGR